MKDYFAYKGIVSWEKELEIKNVCQTALERSVALRDGTIIKSYLLIRTIEGDIYTFQYGGLYDMLDEPTNYYGANYSVQTPRRGIESACSKIIDQFINVKGIESVKEIPIKDFLNNYIDPTYCIEDKLNYVNEIMDNEDDEVDDDEDY